MLETTKPSGVEAIKPDTLPPEETGTVTVDAYRLKLAIDASLVAASRDASRPILTGVMVEPCDGFLNLVATDSYRLSVVPVAHDGGSFSAVILDPAGLKQLSTMLKPFKDSNGLNSGNVLLTFTDTVTATIKPVRADGPAGSIVLPTIGGEYVNYSNLLPNPCDSWAGMVKGGDGVGFNPKYLGDGAKWAGILLRGEDTAMPVMFSAVDGLKPATLTLPGGALPAAVYLLMPVRVAR
jgi:DNA polymerase III sliding clamp (beta) subunit (PCNA family)